MAYLLINNFGKIVAVFTNRAMAEHRLADFPASYTLDVVPMVIETLPPTLPPISTNDWSKV